MIAGASATVLTVQPAHTKDQANSNVRAAERGMHDMAACVAKTHRNAAIRALNNDPAAPDAAKKLLELFLSCGNMTGLTYHVHGDVLRGAIAERLYLHDFKGPVTGLADGDISSAGVAAAQRAEGSPIATRYAVATCAASRDPAAADAFVRATRRSADEAEAGRRLAPALNACASAHVDFNGAELHGVLAEALFKMRSQPARELH